MNKRDMVHRWISESGGRETGVPAAFFMHFDPKYHTGQPAIDQHLDYFRATGMDFVKVQFEQPLPPHPITTPADWANAPLYPPEFFEPQVAVAEGLVKAAKPEAFVVMTLYSPFMWAGHLCGDDLLVSHLKDDPDAVSKGLEIMTQNVLSLVKACRRVGIDGFYASTQGGESTRFGGTPTFRDTIMPTDLAVWDAIKDCEFNILHICDFDGPYDDLAIYRAYPGHVVNASLTVSGAPITPKAMSEFFNRPFMGGMERKGVITSGTPDAVRSASNEVLLESGPGFILAADCTVPGDTPWENLRIAIDTAHAQQ